MSQLKKITCPPPPLLNGEVGNTILNTRGKTGVPLYSVCNKHTGVIWLLYLHDRHIKLQQSVDTCIIVAYWEKRLCSLALCIHYCISNDLLVGQTISVQGTILFGGWPLRTNPYSNYVYCSGKAFITSAHLG